MNWRYILCVLMLSLSAPAWGSTLRSDGLTIRLKSILENLGENVLRALVVDRDGKEARIQIKASDAVEFKRGLWILKAGDYPREI